MTTAEGRRLRAAASSRSYTERVFDQLAGIDAWNQARREAELRAAEAGSRELRLDHARRLDVIRRQHRAVVEATERQLRDTGAPLPSAPPPCIVVVHRNDWFKNKVSAALRAGRVQDVTELSNGADAVGVAVAEQPDMLLLEDKLPMLSALDVLREVSVFAPRTLVTVQVGNDWDIGRFLDAGACAAFNRRIPPAEIADAIGDLTAR